MAVVQIQGNSNAIKLTELRPQTDTHTRAHLSRAPVVRQIRQDSSTVWAHYVREEKERKSDSGGVNLPVN